MRNATAFAFFLNRVSDTNYVKKATEITDSMWPFVLETSDDLVVMNGTVQSVGQLIKDKQKLDSSVKIAYHMAVYTMVNIELPPSRCISRDAEEQ